MLRYIAAISVEHHKTIKPVDTLARRKSQHGTGDDNGAIILFIHVHDWTMTNRDRHGLLTRTDSGVRRSLAGR